METNPRRLFPKGQPQEGPPSDSNVVPIGPKAALKTVPCETPVTRPRQAELPFLATVPSGTELGARIERLAKEQLDKSKGQKETPATILPKESEAAPSFPKSESLRRWLKEEAERMETGRKEDAEANEPSQTEIDPENEPIEVDFNPNLPMKDDLLSMELPLFSLAKTPDTKPRIFNRSNGRGRVRIIPSGYGPATVFDHDLLIYCASAIADMIQRDQTPSRTLIIDTADFLRKTNRSDGVLAYERIIEMLRRLCGTFIETDIPTNGIRRIKGFGIIESYELLVKKERTVSRENKKTGKMEILEVVSVLKFTVTLAEWQYNSIRHEKNRVLAIDDAYFDLDSAIERRLYQIARHHCGRQPLWRISIRQLAEKTGTKRELRMFRDDLRNVIRDDRLPGYRIALDIQANPNVVVFLQKTPPEDDKSPESEKKRTEINRELSNALMKMNLDNAFAWFESLEKKGSAKIQARKSSEQRKARQAELAEARKAARQKRAGGDARDLEGSPDETE